MKVVKDMQDGHEPEPTWEEAHAAFEAAEPAELVRPARKLRVIYEYADSSWIATSPDLDGFEVTGASLAETKARAAEDLAAFLDPAVELVETEPESAFKFAPPRTLIVVKGGAIIMRTDTSNSSRSYVSARSVKVSA
jgi:predicted RNase H-like HicB family nuclease